VERDVFICRIAIAQLGTDYKIIGVCVCVSVCLIAPAAQFWIEFDETLHGRLGPEN